MAEVDPVVRMGLVDVTNTPDSRGRAKRKRKEYRTGSKRPRVDLGPASPSEIVGTNIPAKVAIR
ncbi:hypothetical protein B0H19DRAFT_1250831 [Mycena capillaripes]|nr:hypothetical protein B0H19DRAFT_1250831 [Mycena capillaripes]